MNAYSLLEKLHLSLSLAYVLLNPSTPCSFSCILLKAFHLSLVQLIRITPSQLELNILEVWGQVRKSSAPMVYN
jgi:hypothetical protein